MAPGARMPPLLLAPLIAKRMDEQLQQAHARRMQQKKAQVDAAVERSRALQGVALLLTGHGKGKTTAAFGTLYRALGHGQRAGVVQFITGTQANGEITFLLQQGLLGPGPLARVAYHAMATGCSWNSQDWAADKAAADIAWQAARRMLADPALQLVLLDELTFMLEYGYLDAGDVAAAIRARPAAQNVVITGRNAPPALHALADTVSEIGDTRHAFRAGVRAQAGLDF